MLSSGTRDARQAYHTDILASPAPPADSTRARLVAVAEGATASARERRGWPEGGRGGMQAGTRLECTWRVATWRGKPCAAVHGCAGVCGGPHLRSLRAAWQHRVAAAC